jgi:hypothetical protein
MLPRDAGPRGKSTASETGDAAGVGVTPDARELHRVITASVRELLETARLEMQAGAMDEAQLDRLIFRSAAPIVQSVEPLTEAQRGALQPNVIRVMLAAFLEEQAR